MSDWFEQRKAERLVREQKRRRRDLIIASILIAGIVTVLGYTWEHYQGGDGRDPGTPTSATGNVGSTPTASTGITEQAVTNVAADFIAKHPYTEQAAEKLKAIFAVSRCNIQGLSILEGEVSASPPAGVYVATREYGPKYVESEGKTFTLALKVVC